MSFVSGERAIRRPRAPDGFNCSQSRAGRRHAKAVLATSRCFRIVAAMHRLPLQVCALFIAALFLLPACRQKSDRAAASGDEFLRLSNVGKAQLDRGEAAPAVASFEKALALQPDHPDARLNLANACLLSGDDARARSLAESVLTIERGSAPALYVAGVAALHQRDFTNAIQFLQQARDLDIRINAVSLQLGLAYEGISRWEEALALYEELVQFQPDYPGVHFRLATVYRRLSREADAQAQTTAHTAWLAKTPNANLTPAGLERCKYTEARVPFQLEQPAREGIKVVFTDVTAEAFAGVGGKLQGPVGVIDFARDGTNHLLVRDGDSFRVLLNRGGKFATNGQSFPFTNGGDYTRWLVADLNKDATPDALVLGDKGVHLYRFATNGTATETTRFAGLDQFAAVDGLFADLNFRGDLDLVAIGTNGALRVMSNLQNMYFVDTSTNVPPLTAVRALASDDWDYDETGDLFVSRADGSVTLLLKQRGGAWSNSVIQDLRLRQTAKDGKPLPPDDGGYGGVSTVGDLNNDLRPDLASLTMDKVQITFNGATNAAFIPLNKFYALDLKLIDYDNDGWLDVVVFGHGLRIYRNLGANGFANVTTNLSLDKLTWPIDSLVATDLDGDCDTDFIVSNASSLALLRNDGGNQNHMLRVALQGTRSNASAIGVRVDVVAGGLRVARRAHELPVEIGVGKHRQLDAVNVHWSELSPSYTEIDLTNCAPLRVLELALPTGSCPYLYTWDGARMRFVTDLLCSAPLGLPVAPGIYIEADEDEIVHLGNDANFQPKLSRAGAKETKNYVLNITEELREVLYLDEAKLIVVDHPPGTEVHATEKMLARKPPGGYPHDEIVTLKNRLPLRAAVNDAGLDVMRAVAEIDTLLASPTQLREPQLRGLAEPHSVAVDFGELPLNRPLVLALTGWLRFGGGMANIAASSYRTFPFPFPTLEVEVNGQWQRVDVEVGAPSGRAKTILVDLAGKLPPGAQRLRVTAAFEIHWDRLALFERAGEAQTQVTRFIPSRTDLHRRGYSEMSALLGTSLLVPNYEKVESQPLWRLTPGGWATRYGAVDELVRDRDNALALICAGDELTLEFAAENLPAKPAAAVRDYFLFVSGWDKDSDFHVVSGTTIEPWPWHGLNDQTYGTQPRPAFTNDAWMQKYNTRWVGPRILSHR
jgi:tetratricopeptide (TPR) repeat protein